METSFRAVLEGHRNILYTDVGLRLVIPKSVKLVSIYQVTPERTDLKSRIVIEDGQTTVSLGSWGLENKDYIIRLEFTAQPINERMMLCRPFITVSGEDVVKGAPVVVEWSTDWSLTSRSDTTVSHYKGESEKTLSIDEGVAALLIKDYDTATQKLGNAVRLATISGDTQTLEKISKIADILDSEKGTVRLSPSVTGQSKAALMDLDVSSTRTVKARQLVQ